MRGRSALGAVALSLLTGVLPALADHETNRWNLVTADGFAQGFVRTICPGQIPCQDDAFAIGGDVVAECLNLDDPVTRHCFAQVDSDMGWTASGSAGYLPVAGDTLVEVFASINGERFTNVFEVSGFVEPGAGGPGPVEIAIVHFAGDPNDFNGLEASSAADLIGLGLIDAGDVLGSETVAAGPIDFQVDVTGIPDAEIVIFASGVGQIPELIPGFTALSSNSFNYCFAHSESFFAIFPFPPLDHCSDSDFQASGGCSVGCPTIAANSEVSGADAWIISGLTTWSLPTEMGAVSTTTATLDADLAFLPDGNAVLNVQQVHDSPIVMPQVAVFRFDGNPSVFDGLSPFSVFELVDDGIIGATDVLFFKNFEIGDPESFSTTLFISDTSPNEVVLFATGRTRHGAESTGTEDAPASSPLGVVVLLLLLLAAGRIQLRRSADRT